MFSFQLTSFSGVEGLWILRVQLLENPRFHHIKTVLCLTVLNIPFQLTIMQSYRAAMFVLHIDSFEARAMFAPRSCAVKKHYGASFKTSRLRLDFPVISLPWFSDFLSFCRRTSHTRQCECVLRPELKYLFSSNSRKRKMKSRAEVCFRVCFHVCCELAFYKHRFDKLNWRRTSSYWWTSLEWPVNT